MKLLTSTLALIALLACSHGRAPSEPNCKLQELAIDAALGDADAQHNLGVEFHRGENTPQDFSKAAVMWRLSSNGGVIESFNNLGHLTYHGKGVRQDHEEGIRLWRIAAEKGFAESQVHLGEAYSDGRFLERDYVEAHAWGRTGKHYATLIENEELGKSITELADTLLTETRKKLSQAQAKKAEAKAAEYISKFNGK